MARKPRPMKLDEKVNAELDIFKQQSLKRFQMAERAYNAQDRETKEAIDAMVERIISTARGLLMVKPKGAKEAVVVTVPTDTIQHNALYLATEIVKDLAMLDIRIANFRFDPKLCAVCNGPVKPKVKKKR